MEKLRQKILLKVDLHKATFVKFIIIGISATILTVLFTYILTEYAKLYYLLAAIISTQSGIVWNFLWHDNWTWKNRKKSASVFKRFLSFEAIYVVSQAANVFLLFVFTEYFKIHYILSLLTAIGITFLYNYVMNHKFTFKEQ
ncbi:GtrA family protein [Candidatus Micrarchaeota archaeon]|nr:GtrA family protein [Candidatus Micrarchaeota archaeon]